MNIDLIPADDTVSNNLKAASHSPGARLRLARENAQIGIEDIAAKLRLTRDVVVAIEADNYAKLPGLTFVRGYLRAYAHEMNIDADDIIDEFNRLGLTQPESDAPRISVGEKHFVLSDRLLPITTVIIVAALLLLVVLWWRGQHNAANKNMVNSTNAVNTVATTSNQIPLNITTSDAAKTGSSNTIINKEMRAQPNTPKISEKEKSNTDKTAKKEDKKVVVKHEQRPRKREQSPYI